mmetsp:Transcript_17568/g.38393  ORF Transcript_17568/g.38393 Transcript_17568/m.38393 type:complete len:267 (-) Transcript_17568:908-1708(-)
MLDRVLDQFFQVTLNSFQTTNVSPGYIWYFDNRFSQTGRIRLRKSVTEVLLVDSHAVQNFGIDLFVLDIYQIHLLADTLHSGFGTESGNIGTNKTVGFPGNGFRVNVLVEFHVARVDAENLETTIFVWYTDIDFAIKATESTQCWVDSIGTVGTTNDNDRRTLFKSVHQGQHLTDNTTFNFSIGLFTLGGNGIDFINENDCRGILFCFLKGLSKIRLGFTGHFRHNFGSVDEKEKGTCFIGDRTGNKSLSTSGWSIQQNSTGWLDS